MDDQKLFAKSYDQIDPLVNTVYTFNEKIVMEFEIKKCNALVFKRGKMIKVKTRDLNLPY